MLLLGVALSTLFPAVLLLSNSDIQKLSTKEILEADDDESDCVGATSLLVMSRSVGFVEEISVTCAK
jgi:hypothetical protein